MKTLTTLAFLLSVSPLAAGCMAPTGGSEESTQSTESAMINNGNGVDPDRTLEDLIKDGWSCGPIDGTTVCTKPGSNTTYYCYSNGNCTAGLIVQPTNPWKGITRPVIGPIKASQ